MAPRAFDRYMVCIGMGTHPKLATLTDSEFRAHIVGVLAIAAMAPVRGRLLVGSLPAEAAHIARASGVTVRVAESAVRKLMAVGVLAPDEEHDCLRVHDWEDVNPPPGSSTDRVRRYRANQRNAGETNGETAGVTEPLQSALPEVEVEEELPASTTSQQVARKRVTRRVDQSKLPDDFPTELVQQVDAALTILHRCWDARGGIEPGRRGVGLAVLRNPRADHEQVARKLEHWLLAGKGQRARCGDVASRFGDWVEDEGAAARLAAVGDGMSELDRRRLASANRLAGGAA